MRQFYNLLKINNQGRNTTGLGTLGMLEEVVTWAITASVQNEGTKNNEERMIKKKE